MSGLKTEIDALLGRLTTGEQRVPGVVAMVTDRGADIYEGAAGVRSVDSGVPMTTDTVFAIFSTPRRLPARR